MTLPATEVTSAAETDEAAEKPEKLDPQRLVLLANASMRARRRPLAVVLVWGYELLLAATIAWPAASYVNGVYGAHPMGDAPLFRPGGLALADLAVRARPVMAALSAHASPLFAVGAVLGLIPLALLIVQIAHATPARKSPPLGASLARAWSVFPRFFALMIASAFVQGLLLIAGMLAASATAGGTTRSMGEARAQQLGFVVFAVFLLLTATAGVLHDVARTAAVRFDVGVLRAVRLASNALRRGFLALMWSWGWRAAIGLVPIAIAAALSAKLAGRGVTALWAMAAIHQLVILARVALRASWLAKALRVVDHAHHVTRSKTD